MKPDSKHAVKSLLTVKGFESAGSVYFCGPASSISPLDVMRQNDELASS